MLAVLSAPACLLFARAITFTVQSFPKTTTAVVLLNISERCNTDSQRTGRAAKRIRNFNRGAKSRIVAELEFVRDDVLLKKSLRNLQNKNGLNNLVVFSISCLRPNSADFAYGYKKFLFGKDTGEICKTRRKRLVYWKREFFYF